MLAALANWALLRTNVMLAGLPLEVLELEQMDSGYHSLRLTRQVTWDDFGVYADSLVDALGGHVEDKADSPVERVWTVSIDGASFWLAFEDYALGISLDPKDAAAAGLVPGLMARLRELRTS